jgi:hypothetical protein
MLSVTLFIVMLSVMECYAMPRVILSVMLSVMPRVV